jgi:hypothetical protein
MIQSAAIYEMDHERDRKICISLDLRVTGANHELAQWLLDHPRYQGEVVAAWLGCHERRIQRLRAWAKEGFVGSPYDKSNAGRLRPTSTSDEPLETNDNSEPDDDQAVDDEANETAPPDQIEDNILYVIQRINANAKASNKILRASALDREAAERISTAIERMIEKWRSIQSTLARKG